MIEKIKERKPRRTNVQIGTSLTLSKDYYDKLQERLYNSNLQLYQYLYALIEEDLTTHKHLPDDIRFKQLKTFSDTYLSKRKSRY